jgi:hypothetical protein
MRPLRKYPLALAVALGISMYGLKTVHAELVFEDDLKKPVVEEGLTTDSSADQADARRDMSKADMMRRQRMRAELKNEDMLTQKLEELRLRDEVRRSNELLGSGVAKEQPQAVASAPVVEERVGSAAVQNPATAQTIQNVNPNASVQQAAPVGAVTSINGAPMSSDALGQTVATGSVEGNAELEEPKMRISITPRGGLSSMTSSMYDIEARYAFGLDVGVEVSDHFAFIGGWSYSSYSLGAGTAFSYPTGMNMAYMQRLNMNDNVFSLGVRAYIMGPKSQVRPFIGIGGAYRRGFVNFDDNTVALMRQYNPYVGQDIQIAGFSGYLETGLEFKITKNIALTGSFKYFNVLSSRQSNPLDPSAFMNNQGYYGGSMMYSGAMGSPYYGMGGDLRSQASDALARNNFYQLMAGISVSF